ncbi:MAG: hypothetical protein ACI9HK_003541 [Pirellulaceae bacterium]|jgi:hypothetical protein
MVTYGLKGRHYPAVDIAIQLLRRGNDLDVILCLGRKSIVPNETEITKKTEAKVTGKP